MKNSKSVVSHDTLELYLQYRHEVLLDMNETILKSNNKIIKEYITVLGESEVYHQLEFHQKIMINFFYFKDEQILVEYMKWLYRVYYYKDLNMDYFLYEFEYWIDSCKGYFTMSSMIEIESLYKFLLANHDTIKKLAVSECKAADSLLIDQVYELLIKAQKDECFELCKTKCKTIEEFIDFFTNILSIVMQKVGLMWEESKITVAKEHIASSTLEELVYDLINQFEQKESKNQTVLLSNAPNEFHGLGLKVIAKLLKKEGYTVINIGASAPSQDIIKAVEEFNPDFVLFGITLVINLYDVEMILKNIEKNVPQKSFKVIVGGNAFKNLTNPSNLLDADIYCKDINESLIFINSLNT